MFLRGMLHVLINIELSDQGAQACDRDHSKVIFEWISHVLSRLIMFVLPNKIVLHAAQHHVSSATVDLLSGLTETSRNAQNLLSCQELKF